MPLIKTRVNGLFQENFDTNFIKNIKTYNKKITFFFLEKVLKNIS